MSFCPNCGARLDQGVKFCTECGTKVQNTNSHAFSKSRQETEESYTNCPNCGAVINSFSACCRNCGTELYKKVQATACQELCDRLDYIESTRPKESFVSIISDLANMAFDNQKISKTDKQKIELISNFVVPNTKADILEFIFLAQTRINACEELSFSSDESVKTELGKVWKAKLDQTIEKASLVLSNDADFIKVYRNYQAQKYKDDDLCQYCGGKFKGLFKPVCSKCGKPKDY